MSYTENFQAWLNDIDEDGKGILSAMDEKEKEEAFYQPLAFGTAGMRGIISLGTNRMNVYTVRRATKGLADYINALGAAEKGVVIAYDTRRFSTLFAIEAAKVLSANKVKVWLYEDVRPVPFCSFAVRHLGAISGIMITASHNPKVYNGYKVYGEDGAQMSPEATAGVVKYMEATPYFGVEGADTEISAETIKGLDGAKLDDFITVIGKTVDEEYYKAIESVALSPEAVKAVGGNIKIVYTPIHGTGFKPVTTILGRMGIPVTVVPEQQEPDPEFSTVKVPNPEEADTMKLGVALAEKIGSTVVIGTDPDADRMGIAVLDHEGKFVLLNGNQIGVLLAYYIMLRRKQLGTLPKNGAIVKTIVTTEMARAVADSFGVKTFDVLTGFKFIGEKMTEWTETGEYEYLFGFEESYGSLAGLHARDKDAVVAAMLFAEMVCFFMAEGQTVYDVLQELFAEFGSYIEKAASMTFGGVDGMKNMAAIMQSIRSRDYTDGLGGAKVLAVSDYLGGTTTYACGKTEPTGQPKTDAVKLVLENDAGVCARPSGTEPKLKVYAAAKACSTDEAEMLANKYIAAIKELA